MGRGEKEGQRGEGLDGVVGEGGTEGGGGGEGNGGHHQIVIKATKNIIKVKKNYP